MSNKIYIFIFLAVTACVQNGANIIDGEQYKNNSVKNNNLQPSYMKGTYVRTSGNKVVRDLRINNNQEDIKYTDDDNKLVEVDKSEINNRNYIEKNTIKREIVVITAKKGEVLSRIAKTYNMSLNDIAELNNLKKPYKIYVGQKLKVYKNFNNIKQQKYENIVVQDGDNLIKLASRYNSSVRELATINDIVPPYKVYVGQKLKVPVNNKKINNRIANNGYYVVQSGDNLYSIAKVNNVNINELIKLNNLKKPYKIYVGQKLRLNNNQINNKNKTTYKNKVNEAIIKKDNTISRVEQTKEDVNSGNKVPMQTTKTDDESLFIWPVKGNIIKSFGKQPSGEFNDAINIKAEKGTPILAANDGEIAYAGNELKGYGNIIIIKHDSGWLSIYGYCDTIEVKVKDKVLKGQRIGTVGQIGNIKEPQLYFSVRKGRVAKDPIQYIENK